MNTAKAIVFSAIDQVELRQVRLPEAGAWDVTVELEASAISLGTERWALLGQRPPGDVTFPCIPGYLSIGKIVAVGTSAAKRYQLGRGSISSPPGFPRAMAAIGCAGI